MYSPAFYVFCWVLFGLGFANRQPESSNLQPHPVQNTVSREEAVARKLFGCLKANDKNAFLGLYPTSAEYKALLQKMARAKINGLTQAEADVMAAHQEAEVAQYGSEEMEGLQREAKAAGLPWAKVAYTGFTFEVGRSPVGNRYVNGDVWLKAGKTEWVIEGMEAIETGGGYRLQNVAQIRKLDNDE